jgi:Zn-dependent metalloprotease
MKKIISFLLLTLIICSPIRGQKNEGVRENNEDKSRPSKEAAKGLSLNENSYFLRFEQPLDADKATALRKALNMRQEDSLTLFKSSKDELGYTVTRYFQSYLGLKVFGGEIIAREKQGVLEGANGYFFANLNLVSNPVISPSDAITQALKHIGAEQYQWETSSEIFYKKNTGKSLVPQAVLMFAPINGEPKKDNYRLAYKININAEKPYGIYDVFVDAQTGAVIWNHSRLSNVDATGVADTRYSGTQQITTDYTGTEFRLRESSRGIQTFNMNNGTNFNNAVDFTDSDNNWTTKQVVLQDLTIDQINNNWTSIAFPESGLPDLYVKIYDSNNQTVFTSNLFDETMPVVTFNNVNLRLIDGMTYTVKILDQDVLVDDLLGTFTIVSTGVGINTFSDNGTTGSCVLVEFSDAGLDVHWGMEMTYDFYLNKLNRNSYDNNGALIKSYVHYDNNYGNAFWSSTLQIMAFGDGDNNFNSLTSIDVAGHEFSHAVINAEANLVYNAESGALNESFADIFGTAIEFYAKPATANWTIGEEITVNLPFLRSMAQPNLANDPNTYLGNYWVNTSDISEGNDHGGVHTNSGVQNYWFYLLVNGSGVNDNGTAYNVTGIGLDAATAIAYRNLCNYLTPSSNYGDAVLGSIQAAQDLFGICSPQVEAVRQAWSAVGLDSDVPENLVVSYNNSVHHAIVQWSDNSQVEDGYLVERSVNNSAFTVLASLPSNAVFYVDTLLYPSKNHCYRVSTLINGCSAASSDTVCTLTSSAPPAPILSLSGSGSQANLTWGFGWHTELYYSADGLNFHLLTTATPSSVTYTHTGLPSNMTHYYKAKHVKGYFESAFSNTVSYNTNIATSDVISTIEYFIDTDPGIGYGNQTSVSLTTNLNYSLNISVSGIADGLHLLGVRVKTLVGNWSTTGYSSFLKTTTNSNISNSIVAMEYFIDSDPGVGQGIGSNYTPSIDSTYFFNVNIANLSDGLHLIGYRAKDNNNKWSTTGYSSFLKTTTNSNVSNSIVAMEYFIDADPGFGYGTPVSLGIPKTDVTKLFSVNTSGLSWGTHKIYVRTKDNYGRWSMLAKDDFCIQTGIPSIAFSSMGGLQMSFTSNSNATSYYWNFGDGHYSTLKEPTNQYNASGTYNVCLTLNTNCGTITHCQQIIVPVNAVFNFTCTAATNPTPVVKNSPATLSCMLTNIGNGFYTGTLRMILRKNTQVHILKTYTGIVYAGDSKSFSVSYSQAPFSEGTWFLEIEDLNGTVYCSNLVIITDGSGGVPDSCLVTWTDLVGVTLSGTTLKKTSTTVGWSAGARSTAVLASGQDGWVETKVAEVTKRRIFGLSKLNTNVNHKITYGILLENNGTIAVLENGTNKGVFGNYATNDKFRVERIGTTVRYLKNGTPFYTSTISSTTDLHVDASFHSSNSTLKDTYASFGCAFDLCYGFVVNIEDLGHETCAGANDGFVELNSTRQGMSYNWSDGLTSTAVRTAIAPNTYTIAAVHDATGCTETLQVIIDNGELCYPDSCIVDWTSLVGVSFDGTTVTKTGTVSGWNAGVRSLGFLETTENGFVSMEALEKTKKRIFGLSKINSNSNNKISYAIQLENGSNFFVYENGINKGNFGIYETGDKFSVRKTGTTIDYLKNGVVFYTSIVAVNSKLYVDASLHSVGATLHKVYASFGCQPIYTSTARLTAIDSILLTKNSLVSVEKNIETSSSEIKCYPNPTNGMFTLEYSGNLQDVRVFIFNSLGQLLQRQNLINTKTDFDLNSYPSGLYFVELRTPEGSTIIKVIKQ